MSCTTSLDNEREIYQQSPQSAKRVTETYSVGGQTREEIQSQSETVQRGPGKASSRLVVLQRVVQVKAERLYPNLWYTYDNY